MALPSFDFTSGILTITTDLLELRFDRGEVVYIKDIASAEEFLSNAYYEPANPIGFVGYACPGGYQRVCTNNSGKVTYTPPADDYSCTLTYVGYYGVSEVVGSSLVYDFVVDPTSADISIAISIEEPVASGQFPNQVDLAIVGFTGAGRSALLDMNQITPSTAAGTYYTSDSGNSWNCPNAIACIGINACFGVWSENPNLIAYDRGALRHDLTDRTTVDDIVLDTPLDVAVEVATPLLMYAGPYRITTKSTWVELAARWRERFETLTTAKPLWLNDCTWVRNIHASYTTDHWDTISAWDTVVSTIAGWSGANAAMVLVNLYGDFPEAIPGDVVDRLTLARPSVDENTKLETIRAVSGQASYLPVMSYYNSFRYTVDPPTWFAQSIIGPYLPAGWTITTYGDNYAAYAVFDAGVGGPTTPAGWLAWWADLDLDIGGGDGTNIIQAGSNRFQAYAIANYPHWCTQWYLKTCLWDILGGDYTDWFIPVGLEVVDGRKFIKGVIDAMAALYDSYPIGSEFALPAILPYNWYTYESPKGGWHDPPPIGPAGSTGQGVSHPWRLALTGSYQWVWGFHGAPQLAYDEKDVLFGALPIFKLTTDWDSDWQSPYSLARAAMFCTYQMWNDLPDVWEDGVLAYYRTNTTAMLKFVKRATGRYAYVNADTDAYILQYEFKTGESTGAKTFADTYVSTPTVSVSDGCSADNITPNGFDFTGTGDWLVFGEQGLSNYSRGDYGSLPATDADLETYYSSSDETAVATDDSSRVAQSAPERYTIHQFKKKISANKAKVKVNVRTTIPCANSTVYLQIYNRSGTPAWDTVASDNTTGANTDFDLESAELTLTNYKDDNDFIAVRVQQLVQ